MKGCITLKDVFRVAIHFDNDCGYIEYNPTKKIATVILANLVKRREVEDFLNSKHIVLVAQRTLREFGEMSAIPTESLETLKLMLTRLWEQTGVYVDWSRPVIA
jgi:hypothetical protein